MSETSQDLSTASETSLMAVYIRAVEAQRPDALSKDEKTMALVAPFQTPSQSTGWKRLKCRN